MAILHVPIRMRTYDLNPQGSATALATMSQDNPFDRRVIAKVRDLRGIDLGDASPGTSATPLPTANAAPSFMDSIVSALKGAAATVLPTMAAVALRPVGDSGPVPGSNPIPAPAPVVSTTPKWLIPVGIGAALLVAVLVMRKK
jgi:hypothetical protein